MKPVSDVDVVLASEATWRSDILRQLGISHHCKAHRYNEPKYEFGSLISFVEEIAREKAKSLYPLFPESMIIAADQVGSIEGEVLYKSGSKENAVQQLSKLNNKQHTLYCAVAVCFRGEIKSETDSARLQMRNLSPEEIENYVDKDMPWDCAGSYKIESFGAALFSRIEVNDPTTIIGLPSIKLVDLLKAFGFSTLL